MELSLNQLMLIRIMISIYSKGANLISKQLDCHCIVLSEYHAAIYVSYFNIVPLYKGNKYCVSHFTM